MLIGLINRDVLLSSKMFDLNIDSVISIWDRSLTITKKKMQVFIKLKMDLKHIFMGEIK